MAEIQRKDALVLAHYYTPSEVQEQADFVGDSYVLAKKAQESEKPVIVFCGVSFMGESAKILCPQKDVYIPCPTAHCAMAEMATVEEIEEMKQRIPDLAVVTYINSSAKLKALSTVIVTSSNAQKIVSKLPNKNIYFIPDCNLGRYIAQHDKTGKTFYFGKGCCPIHASLTAKEVQAAKARFPHALFLVHPECPQEVCDLADYVGSTQGIIEFAQKSDAKEFLIGTEEGVLFELNRRLPDKKFYLVKEDFICEDMKKITAERLNAVFRGEVPPLTVDERTREGAVRALEQMLEFAK